MAGKLELFHVLTDPSSAAVRREIVRLGVEAQVEFRNIAFESHREVFEARGGRVTPAMWDGAGMHEGVEASLAVVAALKRG